MESEEHAVKSAVRTTTEQGSTCAATPVMR